MNLPIKKVLDDPYVQQIDKIVEVIENCLQYFHRFKYKSEYKVKFVRGKNGDEVCFTTTNTYKNLYVPIDEPNE